MAGTLFVVATPIGNLEDITLRAIRVLREADVIAAEDTRRTAKLLSHHAIPTPTVSFHAHNSRGRLPQLMARLRDGQSVALVSDAGTPGLSDPGLELIQACVQERIPVDPIPGANAPLAAAVASGFPVIPLYILGFAPATAPRRRAWLEEIAAIPCTVTFFEAPHRIASTLSDAQSVLGERQIVVGRELTKVHQQLIRGTAASVAAEIGTPRGEITVVVGPRQPAGERTGPLPDADVAAVFSRASEAAGATRSAAIGATAKTLGMTRRDVYAAIERTKNRDR